MNLESRLARIETRQAQTQKAAVPPVLLVCLPDEEHVPWHPPTMEHRGTTYVQQPGEAMESFKRRAVDAALATFRPSHPFEPLALVINLPRKLSAVEHSP